MSELGAEAVAENPPDPVMVRMLAGFKGGQFCQVELYVGRPIAEHVRHYAVYKMRPGEYRAQVLFRTDYTAGPRLVGMDGSLSDCARWLRVQGLPVLRVVGLPRM